MSIIYKGKVVADVGGSGGGGILPEILVTVETGATVTAQKSTKTVTATSVDGTATLEIPSFGDWLVTAKQGTEVLGSQTVSVTEVRQYSITINSVRVYGVEWDGTSTTKWSRTDDAAGFTDPVPYVAGASSYGSPFDTISPWKDMVKSERTGGTMVAIPKFYYSLTQSGASMKIRICSEPKEGFVTSPAHMDRGDGKGERDVVYVGRYHCGPDFKSKTRVLPKVSTDMATFRTSIHALGSNIWQSDFTMRFTIWLLYLVEFADWNSQATIGYGCGNNSAVENMGYTDSMPHHTGTMKTSRTECGASTQYRNIEGLWDNCYDKTDGAYNATDGLHIILNPNNFNNESGGVLAGLPTSGWTSAFTVTNTGGFPMFIPSESAGGEGVASCDGWYFGSSDPVLIVGGNYSRSADRGLFCVNGAAVSVAYADQGSRLQELP